MQTQKFSFRNRARSFQFAFEGLHQFFFSQHNAIVHLAATLVVLLLCAVVRLPLVQLPFIIISIALVWMAELFNTAIEKLCDMVCPEQHPQIKFIKDVSAAAVLITAITAFMIACIILIPVML